MKKFPNPKIWTLLIGKVFKWVFLKFHLLGKTEVPVIAADLALILIYQIVNFIDIVHHRKREGCFAIFAIEDIKGIRLLIPWI